MKKEEVSINTVQQDTAEESVEENCLQSAIDASMKITRMILKSHVQQEQQENE